MHIVRADGSALLDYAGVRGLGPGDAILAPSTTQPNYRLLPLRRDVATVLGQLALTATGIVAVFK